MLLRKRVWDIMREEFACVKEDASLAEAIAALRDIRAKQSDAACILVFAGGGQLLGVLSIWSLLQGIGPCLLKGASLSGSDVDWDNAFSQACRSCAQVRITDCLRQDVPVLKPTDPVARILEVFMDYHRDLAVVEEGGRIIGVVTIADVFHELTGVL